MIATTPPASPSSPSIRLIALVTPTTHSSETTGPSQPSWTSPTNGRLSYLEAPADPHEQPGGEELDEELLGRRDAEEVVDQADEEDQAGGEGRTSISRRGRVVPFAPAGDAGEPAPRASRPAIATPPRRGTAARLQLADSRDGRARGARQPAR